MHRQNHLTMLVLLTSLFSKAMAAPGATCPASVTTANATGTVTISNSTIRVSHGGYVHIDYSSTLLSNASSNSMAGANLSYTLSVASTSTSFGGNLLPGVSSTLSVSTHDASLFDEKAVLAACAFPILNLPILTTRYGQDDLGNCSRTLPYGCAFRLLNTALSSNVKSSLDLKESMTATCDSYADWINDVLNTQRPTYGPTDPFSQVCFDLFQPANTNDIDLIPARTLGIPVTSLTINESQACSSVSPQLGGDETRSWPIWNTTTTYNIDGTIATEGSYDEAVRRVYPILTLFFKDLHNQEDNVVPSAAAMSCVRVNTFSQGSRISAQLERATPPALNRLNLSTGQTVGIVFGILAITLVLVVIAWVCKKGKQAENRIGGNGGAGEEYEMK